MCGIGLFLNLNLSVLVIMWGYWGCDCGIWRRVCLGLGNVGCLLIWIFLINGCCVFCGWIWWFNFNSLNWEFNGMRIKWLFIKCFCVICVLFWMMFFKFRNMIICLVLLMCFLMLWMLYWMKGLRLLKRFCI